MIPCTCGRQNKPRAGPSQRSWSSVPTVTDTPPPADAEHQAADHRLEKIRHYAQPGMSRADPRRRFGYLCTCGHVGQRLTEKRAARDAWRAHRASSTRPPAES
jgi:hypothetical protein